MTDEPHQTRGDGSDPCAGDDQGGIFGWLAGTVTVHGDIIAPTGEKWSADATPLESDESEPMI